MSWGLPRRPKIKYGTVSFPNQREGSDGDIQIRETNLGAKLFGKVGGTWYGQPLTATAGDPVTRIGVKMSDHLAITRDSLDIFTDGVKVATFGETTLVKDVTLTGKINTALEGDSFNVMIGLLNSSSGQNNVLIGALAGQNVTQYSDANVLIGQSAGQDLAGSADSSGNTAGNNVFIGNGAAAEVTKGDNNVAIGASAMKNAAGAYFNDCIAIGQNSLDILETNADFNIGIGHEAGNTITTGIGNICIGYISDTIAASAQSIAIGYAATCSGSNGIAIGDVVAAAVNDFSFGKASNVVTNSFDTDNSWSRSSDMRLKTNIQDIAYSGLDFVNELRPVTFNWKRSQDVPQDMAEYNAEENHMTTDIEIDGMIAQEVKTAMDKCSIDRFGGWKLEDSGTQSLSREMFIYPLIKSVQELSAKIDTMQTEINNLKSE